MLYRMDLKSGDTISVIEKSILDANECSRQFRDYPTSSRCEFLARLSTGQKGGSFQDIWASFALASLKSDYDQGKVIAWGVPDWAKIENADHQLENEDSLPYTPAGLYAVGSSLPIVTDSKKPVPLDSAKVMNKLSKQHFVLGKDSSSERVIVEFDNGERIAPGLKSEYYGREKFRLAFKKLRGQLEIGHRSRGQELGDERYSGALADFLFELRQNGIEHAALAKSVRLLKLKKWAFTGRDQAMKWARGFPHLASYIRLWSSKPTGGLVFVEATVSDFGPGIIDGFLATPKGRNYIDPDRAELIDDLIHRQLSSKWGDPNAGKGIQDALAAAQSMGAFVSLRTAEFWKYQDARPGAPVGMADCAPDQPLGKIVGTHWQIVYPDQAAS